MMKTNMLPKTILCAVAASMLVVGCDVLTPGIKGSGKITSEKREATPFTGVLIDGSADMTITYGAEQSVEVRTDDNLQSIITTEVVGGILKVDSKESYSATDGVLVTVTLPKLESIAIDGSGNVQVKNAQLENVPVASFTIDIDGSGNIEVPSLNASTVTVGIDGSGDVKLNGTGEALKGTIDGSGNITADGFPTLRCTADVSGSGDIHVNASESLDATISGSGNVYYRGDPASVKSSVSGSGEIIKMP